MTHIRTLVAVLCVTIVLLGGAHTHASSVNPVRDDEVIEVLPATSRGRAEIRQLRRMLAADARDARSAVQLSRLYLDQAHTHGDPRFVGQAMALLGAWPRASDVPDEVLLMRATLQQFLHDFDSSAANLEQLVARRPGGGGDPLEDRRRTARPGRGARSRCRWRRKTHLARGTPRCGSWSAQPTCRCCRFEMLCVERPVHGAEEALVVVEIRFAGPALAFGAKGAPPTNSPVTRRCQSLRSSHTLCISRLRRLTVSNCYDTVTNSQEYTS